MHQNCCLEICMEHMLNLCNSWPAQRIKRMNAICSEKTGSSILINRSFLKFLSMLQYLTAFIVVLKVLYTWICVMLHFQKFRSLLDLTGRSLNRFMVIQIVAILGVATPALLWTIILDHGCHICSCPLVSFCLLASATWWVHWVRQNLHPSWTIHWASLLNTGY